MIKKLLRIIIYRISLLHILYVFYKEIVPGYRFYSEIKKKNKFSSIYVQYYSGTGDVYLSSSYLNIYQQKKNEEAIFIVNGFGAKKIADLCNIKNTRIISVDSEYINSLVIIKRFVGNVINDVVFLHYMSDRPMYSSIWIKFAGFKGISFWDMYQYEVYKDMPLQLVEINWNHYSEKAEELFNEYEMIEGMTVIIAPKANSINIAPTDEYWRVLANNLRQIGYVVYTNLGHGEEPIMGTRGVFIPYELLGKVIEKAGVFIGYRSGLCDLLTYTKCHKIIIYPDNYWPIYDGLNIGRTVDVFSLKKISDVGTLMELVYTPDQMCRNIKDIVEFLSQNRKLG